MTEYRTPQCVICSKASTLHLEEKSLKAWQAGTSIQTAFPELETSTRELIQTGIHEACWEDLFEPEDRVDDLTSFDR
jgi:hypothetical protein